MFIVILLGLTLLATVIKFQGASRLMNRLGKFIMIAGIYVVIVNLFGLALGPTSVALVTDYVFADASAVGASMAVVCAVSLPVAMLMFYLGMGEGSSSDSEGAVVGH